MGDVSKYCVDSKTNVLHALHRPSLFESADGRSPGVFCHVEMLTVISEASLRDTGMILQPHVVL